MRNRKVGTGEKINWADVIRRFPLFYYITGNLSLSLSLPLSLSLSLSPSLSLPLSLPLSVCVCMQMADDVTYESTIPVHYRRQSLAQIASRVPRTFLRP